MDVALEFPGVFNKENEASWELGDYTYPEKRMHYSSRVNVYFMDREPAEDWGYPAQFHNIWSPEPRKLSLDGQEFYVMIANPTETSYRIQVVLDSAFSLVSSLFAVTTLSLLY